ncbi:MAG: hypothetical protein K2F87_04200 [Muribaculaceae bacterium]|nr:hypothetical protein [Muribaculaceae bacterium]
MKKFVTIASAFALTAAMTTGFAYAMQSADMPEGEGLTIVSSTPAAGTELAGLEEGTMIYMVPEGFAEYPDMYVEYELEGTDENGKWEIVKSMAWMTRDNEAGNYYAEVYGNYPMYTGTDYRLKFTAWESEDMSHGANRLEQAMGYAYVYLKGATKPYENSPYKMVSIDPTPSETRYDNVIPADATKVTVTFDGLVNVDKSNIVFGMGATMNFKAIEPVGATETADKVTYAKEWNLEFPAGYVASQKSPITISVTATDMEGRLLVGNVGEKDYTFWSFEYNVEAQYGEIDFDFSAEPLASVTANFANGISPSYSEPLDAAKVLKDGTEVASVKSVELIFAPGEENNADAVSIGAKLVLDNPVTESGSYTFVVPADYFSLGTQFTVWYQRAVEVDFEVGKGVSYSVVPEAGKVEKLMNFEVTYDVEDELAVNEDATERPYLLCGENNEKAPFRSFDIKGKALTLTLVTELSDPDDYSLVIPAGYLTAGGNELPAVIVNYVIENTEEPVGAAVNVTPAAGKVEALPELLTIVFTDYDEIAAGAGKATIQLNDETPVALPDLTFDWDAPLNEMQQPLGEYAGKTDEGTYTVTFPAGYFQLGANGNPSDEITLVYTIGEGGEPVVPDMAADFTPANNSVLTELPVQIDFVFPAYEDGWIGGTGNATIAYNDNEPVALPDAEFDWDAPLNEGWQPLGEYAGKTDAGTYTVTFPAGYFQLGSNGVESPEMVLTYTIEGSVAPATHGVVSVAYGTEMAMSYKLPLGEEAEITMAANDEFWGIAGYVLNDVEETFENPVKTYTAKFTVEAQNSINFLPEYFGICEIMDGTDEVVNLEGGIQVKRTAEGVEITGLSVGTPIVVYSVNGQLIRQETAHNETVSVTLEKGATYVVRAGEVAVKVLF